jgi:hypothetical protein
MPLVAVAISLLATKATSKFGANVNYIVCLLIWNVFVLLIGGVLLVTKSPEPQLLTIASIFMAFVSVTVYTAIRFQDALRNIQQPSIW